MSERLWMRRVGQRLEPASQWDAELLENLPAGKDLSAVVTQMRSEPQNAMYWVGLQTIIANLDGDLAERYRTRESFHRTLLIALGYVEVTYKIDGTEVITPASTAFHAMSQKDFSTYFSLAQAKVKAWLGWSPWESSI